MRTVGDVEDRIEADQCIWCGDPEPCEEHPPLPMVKPAVLVPIEPAWKSDPALRPKAHGRRKMA